MNALTAQIKRTVRVFLSNTAHDQPWQAEQSEAEGGTRGMAVDIASGKGIAGWVLRIEGRLLDVRMALSSSC